MIREVPTEVLLAAGINQWMGPNSLPLWLADPAARFAMIHDSTATVAAGSVRRPLRETLRAALAQQDSQPPSGLTEAEESALRALIDEPPR